nr:P27 family phage terminase small subunit [Companilactobacillus mishanensis]
MEQSKANLTKQEQEAKFNAEVLASDGYKMLQTTPPKRLTGVARAEWKRIVPDLRNLPIRAVDRSQVEMYCVWYQQFYDITKKMATINDVDKRLKYLTALDKTSKNLKSAAAEIGLTLDSRMRMNVPKTDDKPKELKEIFG